MPPLANIEDIPGYREAIEREREIREACFAGIPEFIGPVEVLPLTFVHIMRLAAIGSPFFVGKTIPEPRDTALFLWSVSPEYETALRIRAAIAPWSDRLAGRLSAWMRNRFYKRLKKVDWNDLAFKCFDYLDEAFMDGPSIKLHDTGFKPSYWAGAASRVTSFGEIFGWTPEVTMNLPVKVAFQIERCLNKGADSKHILFNRSDKVRGEWLKQQQDREHD